MTRAIVIYHANCLDGFGAAWAFRQLAAKNYISVLYAPASYGDTPPVADKDDDVFILDFSYAPDVMMRIAKQCKYLIWIDHHKTAIEAWKKYGIEMPANMSMRFTIERSGAMLTWNNFSNEPAPKLIQHIEDRDLWKFALPGTKEYCTALSSYPMDFAIWDSIFLDQVMYTTTTNAYNDFIAEGETILRYYNQQLLSSINATKRKITIDGHEGLCCNLPPMFDSDAGNILARESGTFGAVHFTGTDDSTKFSLRSIGDYDVSAIAKKFGGGGHRNAAGFQIVDPVISENGITIWSTHPELEVLNVLGEEH